MVEINVNDSLLPSIQFARLSREQCRQIHWTSLEILERVGARLYLQEAIDLVKAAGADVSDGNLVRVPSGLVERALTTVPKRVVLFDRNGKRAMPVQGHNCFYGPGSDCLHILDHRTGERRDPVLQDVVEGVTLADALPNIDFVMSMVLPSDVDKAIADRYQMEVMLTHTTKPLVFVTYEFDGCADAVEMAEAVVGGEDTLRHKPLMACYINVTSGLRHNEEALQKLLFLAGKRLPAIYVPVATGGVIGPVTAAGSVAVSNAGVLLGLVLSQLKREGAPFIMPGWAGSPMDLRSLVVAYCDPVERGIMQAMAHFYDLPMFGLAGASESKAVDQQSGAEAALTLMAETLAGSNIIHDMGYLESGVTYSFAQLALCDEIVSWISAFARGADTSPDALALDAVTEVGTDGQFLDTEHTFRHYREGWYPRLFDRNTYETWQERGGKNMAERASERVNQILAEHKVEPPSEAARKRLREIVERAQA